MLTGVRLVGAADRARLRGVVPGELGLGWGTATSSSSFHAAIFDDVSATVAATTWLPALTVLSPATGVRSVEPHASENIFLARSTSDRTFAS